jgi:hypothetical protein
MGWVSVPAREKRLGPVAGEEEMTGGSRAPGERAADGRVWARERALDGSRRGLGRARGRGKRRVGHEMAWAEGGEKEGFFIFYFFFLFLFISFFLNSKTNLPQIQI